MMKNSVIRLVLPSIDGPIGISITPKEAEQVADMQESNPEKYPPGAEGVLKALQEIKEMKSTNK